MSRSRKNHKYITAVQKAEREAASRIAEIVLGPSIIFSPPVGEMIALSCRSGRWILAHRATTSASSPA